MLYRPLPTTYLPCPPEWLGRYLSVMGTKGIVIGGIACLNPPLKRYLGSQNLTPLSVVIWGSEEPWFLGSQDLRIRGGIDRI